MAGTRTTWAMRIENMLTMLDRMQEASRFDVGISLKDGTSASFSSDKIDEIRGGIDNHLTTVLKMGTERINVTRDVFKNEREYEARLAEIDKMKKEGSITVRNEINLKNLAGVKYAEGVRSNYQTLKAIEKSILDAAEGINKISNELHEPDIFREGEDANNIANGIYMQYSVFGETYMKTLDKMIDDFSKGKIKMEPPLMHDNTGTTMHLDIVAKASELAQKAAEELVSLDIRERRYLEVNGPESISDVNVHVVKDLPTTKELERPALYPMDFMRYDGYLEQRDIIGYLNYEPDKNGIPTLYVPVGRFLELTQDAMMMFSGEFVDGVGGDVAFRDKDSYNFNGNTKEMLEKLGYDTKHPENMNKNAKEKILRDAFESGKLVPWKVKNYLHWVAKKNNHRPERRKIFMNEYKNIDKLAAAKDKDHKQAKDLKINR